VENAGSEISRVSMRIGSLAARSRRSAISSASVDYLPPVGIVGRWTAASWAT